MYNLKRLVKEQERIAKKVSIKDDFERVKYIGGADVSFDKKYAYGCIVVMDIDNLSIVDYAFSKTLITIPYIPTFLSFREQKSVILSYRKLKIKPDILLCDGQGIAHPRRAGLACAIGIYLNIPTIGIAKTRLCGEAKVLKQKKGSYSYLYYNKKKVGMVLRTQNGIKPVYVSPGHKISIATSHKIVKKSVDKYRIPDPLRYAHTFSNFVKKKVKLELLNKLTKKHQKNTNNCDNNC